MCSSDLAMVREVTVDASGRANGVHYVDKRTRIDEHVSARVVVLAASACESARIMLNSKSSAFPDGLGNGSGLVGKYVMDTVGAGVQGQIPALENMPPHNADGASAMHLYMPWWLYGEQARGRLDFARGYHIEFGGGRKMPGYGVFGGMESLTGGSYGQQFKDDCRRYYGSFMFFDGRGEMIPNDDCYCEIDPDAVDQWGIPTLRFHWKWSEHELNQARHMQRTFASIIEAMGGRVTSAVHDDGADVLFGDLGNDWLVGGTGRDHLWGGRGDDLMNADDNHRSAPADAAGDLVGVAHEHVHRTGPDGTETKEA